MGTRIGRIERIYTDCFLRYKRIEDKKIRWEHGLKGLSGFTRIIYGIQKDKRQEGLYSLVLKIKNRYEAKR